jgi:RimJ/RimL family protein N-acetyltransferase
VPRRLTRPEAPLTDEVIRLAPLTQADDDELRVAVDDDDVRAYTMIPSDPAPDFVEGWIRRYEQGWEDGSRAGFSIRDAGDGSLLGFAAIVHLDLDAQQGEIGYLVVPAARGRGAAARAVDLLTAWGFGELALERLELRIDVANTASERVAERSGYRREGVLRSAYFKEGRRTDAGIWSRLPTD